MTSRISKFLASFISLALLAVSPGLAPYRAWAQRAPGRASPTPMAGAPAVVNAHASPGIALPVVSAQVKGGLILPGGHLFPGGRPGAGAPGIQPTRLHGAAGRVLPQGLRFLKGSSLTGTRSAGRMPATGRSQNSAIGIKGAVAVGIGQNLEAVRQSLRSSDQDAAALAGRPFDRSRASASQLVEAPASGSLARGGANAGFASPAFRGSPGLQRSFRGLGLRAHESTLPRAETASAGGKLWGLIKSAGLMAFGGAAVAGAHYGSAMLLPALFGSVPMAGVWGVASGLILLPLAAVGRLLLARHGEKSLGKVRALLDVSMGGLLGAAAAALGLLPFALPAADGVVGLAPLLGMGSLAAMTTITFYLAQIVGAAKSGYPLRIAGSPLSWPTYFWTGMGAYFSHLSGMVTTNTVVQVAFGAWMFLGHRWFYNLAYLGAFAYSAFTGWTSPLAFVVLAFFPERAARWTAQLLERMYRGKPNLAGGMDIGPGEDASGFLPEEEMSYDVLGVGERLSRANEAFRNKYPNFHYGLKTALLFGAMTSFFGLAGAFVFGLKGLLTNLAVAGGISLLTFWFSHKLVIAAMKGEKAKESDYPQLYKIVRELTEKNGMPMPEIYTIPTDIPNAFATGRSPKKAVVGVTLGILDMLTERQLRGVLGHELSHVKNRDMLSSVISGSLASAIAFAAYGLMWIIASAKKLTLKGWNTLVGNAPKAMAEDRAVPLSGPQASKGQQPEWIDPLTGGIALKTATGMVQVFLALWAPIVATVLQMAISRTRELAADADGSKLTEDPIALAEALQALSSWRPRGRFRGFDRLRLPLIAAVSGFFTVPFLGQFMRSHSMTGIVDKGTASGKVAAWFLGEDFLFRFFVTHPPTYKRIQRLREMAGSSQEG